MQPALPALSEPALPQPARSLRRGGRWWGRLGLATLDLALVGLALYALLRLALGNDWWVLRAGGTFAHWGLLPALLLVPLPFLRRRWALAPVALFSAVAYLSWFGGLWLPKNPGLPAEAPALTVMTFNIASYRSDPERLVAAIRTADADVVAMQEVSQGHAAELDRHLAERYPHRVFLPDPLNTVTGKALLSRYPITRTETFVVPWNPSLSLEAWLDVEGQPLQLLNIHPPPPLINAQGELFGHHFTTETILAEALARLDPDVPSIIACDCNLTDQHPPYALLEAAGLRDAWRQNGWGFGNSFPAGWPLIRIDYLWADSLVRLGAVQVLDGGSSDHRPVRAEVALLGG
ncbi:MAG: hypothetical protein HC915_18100 [Anaerolineae bacterium]|nr:hypothetical protein [Anaerolineae bacterium]